MSTTESTVAKLTVSTVRQALVEKGKLQIVAATRTGKDKKEIPADQKLRAIIIPEFVPDVSSKYTSIVVGALTETAKQQLAAQWEADPMLREVDAALYTESSILAFAAREAENKKLTAAAIKTWYLQSALYEEMKTKYQQKQLDAFTAQLENIAAPIPSYTEEAALKRIVSIAKHERDAEHEVAMQMVAKLTRYVDNIKKQRESLGDLADIAE